jgi:uncharacterized protein
MQTREGIDGAERLGATEVFALYRRLAVERFGHDLDRIVLFGSRARRDDHEDSDWDVAVFLKRAVTAADQRSVSEVGYHVMCETGAMIQSMALPAARWLANDELIRNIRRDGVPIYE